MIEANKKDEILISKGLYLLKDIDGILPETIDVAPMMTLSQETNSSTQVNLPKPSAIHSATTPEALAANDQLLHNHGFNLKSLLDHSQDTMLWYSSAFRSLDQLEKVLHGHPEFPVLEGLIRSGMRYRFKKEFEETEILKEL